MPNYRTISSARALAIMLRRRATDSASPWKWLVQNGGRSGSILRHPHVASLGKNTVTELPVDLADEEKNYADKKEYDA